MKAIIQRVENACVSANGVFSGLIESGFCVLLGVCEGDTKEDAELLARKTANLRIFCDENDKMNLSLLDTGGCALVVSNFTLCADTKKGNRPSFAGAMEPKTAEGLYKYYCYCLKKNGVPRVATGVFGAEMKLCLSCNGPVTIILDTEVWRKPNEN